MKSKIIVYFAFDSLLETKTNVTKRAQKVFKDNASLPLYIENSGLYYMCENLVTRLENLRNKPNIETVLLLPYDRFHTEGLINKNIISLFNRTYCANELYDETSPMEQTLKVNVEQMNGVVNTLNNYVSKGLHYEFLSYYDISPSVTLYNKNEKLLKNIAMRLIGQEMAFSFYIENGYAKLYLNNLYLNLIQKDSVHYMEYSHKNILTMYIGSTKSDLDLVGKCSASILPSFIVEEKVNNSGFSSIAHIISTIKSPIANSESLANYAINAQNELNSFINKIVHNG